MLTATGLRAQQYLEAALPSLAATQTHGSSTAVSCTQVGTVQAASRLHALQCVGAAALGTAAAQLCLCTYPVLVKITRKLLQALCRCESTEPRLHNIFEGSRWLQISP